MTNNISPFLGLEIPELEIEVVVKMDDEGIVIDVWDDSDTSENKEPIASTWQLYSEFGKQVTNIKEEN